MEFKQDQVVVFKTNVLSHNEEFTAGIGTMGMVTVVGVDMPDGSTDGIEVLADGTKYFHCYPRELDILGNTPMEDRPEMLKDEEYSPQSTAVALVAALFYPGLDVTQVYIVWYVTALQNWKALVSTNVADNCYYEVTHNGTANETYVDRYVKEYNVKITYHESGKLEDADVEFNKI